MTTDEMREFANRLAGRGANMDNEVKEAVSHIYRVGAEIIDALDRNGEKRCSKKTAPKKAAAKKIEEPSPEEKDSLLDKAKKIINRPTKNKAKKPAKHGR